LQRTKKKKNVKLWHKELKRKKIKDRELWKKTSGSLLTQEMAKQGREIKGYIWNTFTYTRPFYIEECFK
jgi:transposase